MGQERVTLTRAEWKKVLVVEKILDGHMTNAEGAAVLGLGVRQVIRLKKKYVEEGGAQALAHGNRGRKPKHAIPEEVKDHVVGLYTTTYHGSNNCRFAELLEEHESIKLSTPSVRRILLSKGIKQAKPRRRKKAHQPRQRKPQAGMPPFGDELDDTRRWHLVNYLRANETAGDPRQIGTAIELDNGWLVAPDFTFSVGSLAPRTLREFRGRRMVLLVLYALPESRERMTELARRYGALSVLGVEVIAVAPRSSAGTIAELGSNPPTFFPVITAGNEDIDSTYRMFAPGGSAHTEFLIDRQGYIRAMWRSDRAGMPSAAAVQAEVERLNEEKAPPPLPDDHIH